MVTSTLVAGCDEKSAPLPAGALAFDEVRIRRELAERSVKAVYRSKGRAAIEATAKTVFAEPSVVAAGEALVAQLGTAPRIAAMGQRFSAKLEQSEANQAIVAALRAEHPDADLDALDAMLDKRLDRPSNEVALSRGWHEAVLILYDNPAAQDAVGAVGRAIEASSAGSAVGEVLEEILAEAPLGARLVALNEGKRPDRDQATALMLSQALTPSRVDDYVSSVAALPTTGEQLALALRQLAASSEVAALLTDVLGPVMASAAFEEHALGASIEMMKATPDPQVLVDHVKALMASTPAQQAFVGLVDGCRTEPVVGSTLATLVTAITQAPGFRKALEKLFRLT
jgi:hypothetical protein